MAGLPLSELGVRPVDDPPLEDEPGALQRSLFSRAFSFRSNGARRQRRLVIEYLHVHEDADLSLGVFCLPRGASLPLHNHPGMTVLSRVLYGDMHVRAFDWAEPAPGGDPWAPRRATLVADRVMHAGEEPALLQASSGGNMHAFTAASSCAVLDLLAPPYDTNDPDKDCTYYRELPDSGGQPGTVLLQAHEPLNQDKIVRGPYGGAHIATKPHAARTIVH
ncbi:hypothetical protein WJX81_002037 [Elliptochloris bilobata]|uniref:cysteine dioxygenase n=1 Tax=Elliptochloris bilobata TaxID=381761 RepID=A0AAW1RCI9_9CHLO